MPTRQNDRLYQRCVTTNEVRLVKEQEVGRHINSKCRFAMVVTQNPTRATNKQFKGNQCAENHNVKRSNKPI